MLDNKPSIIPLDQLSDAVAGSVDLAQQDQTPESDYSIIIGYMAP